MNETPSMDEVRANLEAECAEGRIFRIYGTAGDYIVWAVDSTTAMSVYNRRASAISRNFLRLSWEWLGRNMRSYELVELLREGIVRQR